MRLTSVLFIIFCFQLGLFLLIYPWTEGWGSNYFSQAGPEAVQYIWRSYWTNGYFRGAVSGLGILNMAMAILDVFKLFAKSNH